MNPFAALISMLISIYINIILLRFFLQYFRADFYNPLSQFVVKATDPLVKPIRKIVPGFGGIDLSTLILAWLFAILSYVLVATLSGQANYIELSGVAIFPLISVIQNALTLYMFLIIIRAIASWVSPAGYNPVLMVIGQLTEPLISKARKIIPATPGFDLAPMLVLVILYFINYSISYYLV